MPVSQKKPKKTLPLFQYILPKHFSILHYTRYEVWGCKSSLCVESLFFVYKK